MGRQLYAMLRPKVPLEHFRRRRMAFRLLPPFVDELPHQRLYGDAPRSRLLLEPALVLRIQARTLIVVVITHPRVPSRERYRWQIVLSTEGL